MISDILKEPFYNVKHSFEINGELNRPEGIPAYNFWHFHLPVKLLTPQGIITTREHACCVAPPNTPQYYSVTKRTPHDWFHFDEKSAAEWLGCGLEFNKIYYPANPSFITDAIWEIEAEYINKKTYYEKYIDNLISNLFCRISRACDGNDSFVINPVKQNEFQEIRMKLFADFGKKWTVEQMAAELNISQSYFYSTYKKIFGVSPTEDLINIRISNAKKLLQFTSMPIKDIAAILGYSDPYHFSHQFRNTCGVSPREFRKTYTSG